MENKNYIKIASPKQGKSFIGEALELLNKDGFLLVSSIQRNLELDYKAAESVLNVLIKKGIVKKSPENHTYIKS